MPTYLVTGGAGFIGGTFVRRVLADSDARVVNLDKLTYAGNLESLVAVIASPRHTFVEGERQQDDVTIVVLQVTDAAAS